MGEVASVNANGDAAAPARVGVAEDAAGASASAGPLRSADQVMRLARMGAFHRSRLSFMPTLMRALTGPRWSFNRRRFDIDAHGEGVALYEARYTPADEDEPARTYTLVAFAHDLPPEQRSDRVIAEAWDATFTLFDGTPCLDDVKRLQANVPYQEAGRCAASELVLSRANRSVRLFDHVVEALSEGRQPDADLIDQVGYLMRTTAVYGNGKFGLADRALIEGRPDVSRPFGVEMLTVWLIRAFSLDLVEHMARLRARGRGEAARAVALDDDTARALGVGNATGLGMAPFLVAHPALLHRWIAARETALARVRAVEAASDETIAAFEAARTRFERICARWHPADPGQRERIATLQRHLIAIRDQAQTVLTARLQVPAVPRPWDQLYRWSEAQLDVEGQEALVSLLIDAHPALVDDLADQMADDGFERAPDGAAVPVRGPLEGRMGVAAMAAQIEAHYGWALAHDFDSPAAQAHFWYVSEEKLEPRFGTRATDEGAAREQPLAIARDMVRFHQALRQADPDEPLAAFLLRAPEHRHVARRVPMAARLPYAEIRDNLLAAGTRPIDMLRCKLSFFGATRFDPRSDLWLRITMFQGAPRPTTLMARGQAHA
ncbi:MAG: hypothetical protein AAFR04_14305 [Pseudomonadota bacterium]